MAKYDVIYNTGSNITGTTQSNHLAFATGSPDYSLAGWVAGVADDSSYLFVSNSTDLSLTGRSAGAGASTIEANRPTFWKTNDQTDAEVLRVINKLPQRPQNYTDATAALAWARGSSYYTVYGDNFVTAGLALHLDAGNSASYPGSGTTWTSLVNGYTGTLGAGVGYSSSSGGVLTFNGASNASVDMYASASSLLNSTNNISIEAWYQSNNNFPGIVVTGQSSSGFVLGYYSGTGTSWKVTKYGVIDLNAGAIPQNTAWHQVVLTYSSTTGARIYVDGALSTPTSANTSSLSRGDRFFIGKSEAVQLNGSMGIFRWYTTVLSAADVLQNYNANRLRFGI